MATPATEHDPIIAAAATWRAALASVHSMDGRDEPSDAEMFALMDVECRAAIAALQTVPTTPAGLRVFCEMGVAMSADAIEKGDGMGGWAPGIPLGLSLPSGEEMYFATLGAAVSALLPAVAVAAIDPVFAAIELHVKAYERVNSLDDDELEEDRAGDGEFAALQSMLATPPTTTAGLLAYLDHIESRHGYGDHTQIDDAAAKAILASIRRFAEAVR